MKMPKYSQAGSDAHGFCPERVFLRWLLALCLVPEIIAGLELVFAGEEGHTLDA
jgi:hypothetical protein